MIKPGCLASFICAIILLSATTMHSYSQSPLQISCGSLHLAIPDFKTDTVQSFANEYVKDSILPSITASEADIEIRMYESYLNTLYIIKCTNETVETRFSRIRIFHPTLWNLHADPAYVKWLRTDTLITKIKGDFDKGNAVCVMNINQPSHCLFRRNPSFDSAITALIKNNIGTLPDMLPVVRNLQKKNINYEEPGCSLNGMPIMIEVKFHNQYRNFRVAPGYYRHNECINDFKNGYQLVELIDYIIKNATCWEYATNL